MPGAPEASFGRPRGPERRPQRLEHAFRRVRRVPNDAAARFELAVALFRAGRRKAAIDHLGLSFRLDRLNVLRLLKEDPYRRLRSHPEIRRLLDRFHRDEQRRVLAAYA